MATPNVVDREPDGTAIEPQKVKHAFFGALTLIIKVQGLPNLAHIHEAVRNAQHETKTAAQNTIKAISDIRDELQNANKISQQTITTIQDNANVALATGATAKEAVEIGKATYKMVKEMKPGGTPSQSNMAQTYASIVARGGLTASMHNPVNHRASPVQAQREIIVNIRDPVTITNIRAMSPRSLKAHVDRAIEQSNNEHINKIKVVSSNQLKSGDLSIKTVTSAETEALRQFAEDWEHRIGNGATVRIVTYGVLAHGIRPSSMDMDHFDEVKDGILQDNKPFIPNAEIKYIGWLTRSSPSKSASSVIVEFARAEDANRIIDEGLIWQGEVFQATIACGYCAQDHPTRECPTRNDDKAPRKCAACRGEHEAWSGQCPTRKEEMAKVKAAYKARPNYHPETPLPLMSPTKKIQKRQVPTSSQPYDKNADISIHVANDSTDAENARPKRAYNVRKSKDTVMATLPRDPRIQEYDIIAIQEPWRNPFSDTTHHPAKDLFHLCYPRMEEGESARVCFFISKQLDHSQWHFKETNRYLCTLILETKAEGGSKIAIHNVSEMQNLRQMEQIIIGDFNLHHEHWGGKIMDEFSMTSHLREGTITFEEADRRSTIDLSLTTIGLVDRLIRCEIDESINHDSDHLPIVTSLDLAVIQLQPKMRLKWKAIDEAAFTKTLKQELPSLRRPRTKTALDAYVTEITTALNAAIEAGVPHCHMTPRSRPGWNEECSAALAETKRLRRIYSRDHTEESWEAYRLSRSKKKRLIGRTLRQSHRERVEQAAESPESLWRIAKCARNRHSQTSAITPALQDPATAATAITPGEKAELFRKVFFPKPPDANLDDIDTAVYVDQISLPPIAEQEVEDAIRNAVPLKAPGPDGIVNRALQIASPWIRQHLTRIFNQSLSLRYCPQHFRSSTTVVIRKPGKDNYTAPKSYRPIALLNTIGKIMDAIVATRLSYIAETYQLLPATHMGGRKLRSTEHALHYIIDRIYDAWNKGGGMVASLLLLDVSGAFDNISHRRLLHNLRKRRVDEKTVRWIASFLGERQTELSIDGFQSEPYKLTTGEPQGSPLSPILYLFYNADLLDRCNQDENTAAMGFIDDVAILAWAKTTEETCTLLQAALREAEDWASSHASVFAPDKFQLTHLTRAKSRIDTSTPLQTRWGVIKPKPTCKYLGVTMDSKLRWRQHIDEMERKVSKTIAALSCLGNTAWGARTKEMRTIYRGVALPQMMYACSAWSNAGWPGNGYTQKTLRKIQSLQGRAARVMSGAYKATSLPALDVEMHLLPIEQQIWKHNIEALDRIGAPSRRPTRESQRRRTKISPLEAIQKTIHDREVNSWTQEQIDPFVAPPWWQGPQTYIEEPAEEARKKHLALLRQEKAAIHIYTDGSGINGQIGAAAVCPTIQQTRSSYMGTEDVSTVYAGELQGISLALDIAQRDRAEGYRRSKVVIYTDNQAAIRSSAKPKGKSGAYLLKKIVAQTAILQENNLPIEIRWVPAHTGVQGNEDADKAAKEATGWRERGAPGPRAEMPAELYSLRSTRKTWTHKEAHKAWAATWAAEKRGRTSYRCTPKPTKKVLRLHGGLSKRQSALLVQLRTEKIGLKDFLFNRRVPDTTDANCPCREGRQTVSHILLRCRTYRQLRRQELGQLSGRHDLRDILSERKAAAKAIKFMELTEILGQFRIESQTRQS
ncbi:reverse transcriptase [Purpureocillium lavendulum]|uniref:Reverse transcriptase n=1 Tax=Purpureocillium lavendulum TaxID=1247861 RepID=A0AB34FJX6_9HYPO|nr:reverse transcriptase [Purpureocillium lavendulum]